MVTSKEKLFLMIFFIFVNFVIRRHELATVLRKTMTMTGHIADFPWPMFCLWIIRPHWHFDIVRYQNINSISNLWFKDLGSSEEWHFLSHRKELQKKQILHRVISFQNVDCSLVTHAKPCWMCSVLRIPGLYVL